ncbi:MAG: molybdopterin-dependent oxidoreductase [Telluria sp.]
MDKRHFLATAALAGAAPLAARAAATTAAGPTLLTVTGLIGKSNRGPLDPALDQMMHKQQVAFDKAWAFDWAALAALPAVTIHPTLEYDGKAHALKGPLLVDVAAQAGALVTGGTRFLLRAVDGYVVALPAAQARAERFIVATHLDGKPMPLGGLGPLWAVYDADRVPGMAARPVAERFTLCPWALYHIEVQ